MGVQCHGFGEVYCDFFNFTQQRTLFPLLECFQVLQGPAELKADGGVAGQAICVQFNCEVRTTTNSFSFVESVPVRSTASM